MQIISWWIVGLLLYPLLHLFSRLFPSQFSLSHAIMCPTIPLCNETSAVAPHYLTIRPWSVHSDASYLCPALSPHFPHQVRRFIYIDGASRFIFQEDGTVSATPASRNRFHGSKCSRMGPRKIDRDGELVTVEEAQLSRYPWRQQMNRARGPPLTSCIALTNVPPDLNLLLRPSVTHSYVQMSLCLISSDPTTLSATMLRTVPHPWTRAIWVYFICICQVMLLYFFCVRGL
jgi:hypothetical protein